MNKHTVYEFTDTKYRIPSVWIDTRRPDYLKITDGFEGNVSVDLKQVERLVKTLRKARKRAKKR